MSKKSRRRNKRLLALAGLIGVGTLAAKNKRNKSIDSGIEAANADKGSDMLKKTVTPKKKSDTAVKTSTTIMDSMPARTPKNEKSIRVKDGKVFTIKGAKAGEKAKVAGIDTPGIAVNDKGNITAGGKQYYDKNQYKTRNDKPGMLGDSGFTSLKTGTTARGSNTFNDKIRANNAALKDGGRANYKSGGKVKGCGKALRGFGKAMKGNR